MGECSISCMWLNARNRSQSLKLLLPAGDGIFHKPLTKLPSPYRRTKETVAFGGDLHTSVAKQLLGKRKLSLSLSSSLSLSLSLSFSLSLSVSLSLYLSLSLSLKPSSKLSKSHLPNSPHRPDVQTSSLSCQFCQRLFNPPCEVSKHQLTGPSRQASAADSIGRKRTCLPSLRLAFQTPV